MIFLGIARERSHFVRVRRRGTGQVPVRRMVFSMICQDVAAITPSLA